MKPGEIFYELGCGDGRVTLAIGQKPRAVGVELSIAQWIVAQVRRVQTLVARALCARERIPR